MTTIKIPPDYLDLDARTDPADALRRAAFALAAGADTIHVRVAGLAQARMFESVLAERGLPVGGIVTSWNVEAVA